MNSICCKGACGTLVGFSTKGLPCVQFPTKTIEVPYHTWEIHRITCSGYSQTVASRKQIPLVIAATSIHKSQNLKFEYAIIDCSNIYAVGQFYTACSKVKTQNGIVLRNFHSKCIKTNYKVVDFDNLHSKAEVSED